MFLFVSTLISNIYKNEGRTSLPPFKFTLLFSVYLRLLINDTAPMLNNAIVVGSGIISP